MRRPAAEISGRDRGERLPVAETRDEVQRLGETLNEMLGRLDEALARERDFVADAGHELRTPLALLRTELELALRHAESEDELRDAMRRSAAEVDRLTQLADDLLLIAGSDRGKLSLRARAASGIGAARVGRPPLRVAGRGGGQVGPRPAADPHVSVHGDRIRLEQALGNLVDNSLRHGGGRVRLEAVSVDGVVELHVADEGSGFPPDFLPTAFERFSRPDPARTGAGAGLRTRDRPDDRRRPRRRHARRQP